MSRPVAGVRKKTLIITLPGSPKGAKENLEAILKMLPHACMQAAGMDSRVLHAGGVKKLEKEAGITTTAAGGPKQASSGHSHDHHHHHHHHGHGLGGHQIPRAHTKPSERPQSNDPSAGPTQRYRESPYPMLSVDEAIAQIVETAPAPISTSLPFVSDGLINYTIASTVRAKEEVPAYRASIVDGYAVIVDPSNLEATQGTFPVASVSHAQASSMPPPLEKGTIARITTGAPLPANANAVVMVEDTTLVSSHTTISADSGAATIEEKEVKILTGEVKVGENIREAGSDVPLNSVILEKGTLITPVGGEIGLLAATGTRDVPVYRKPAIGILSTGDEVVDLPSSDPSLTLHGGQIRDSNRPSLLSLVSSWNLCTRVVDLGIARDTPAGELERALRDGFRVHDLDIIVTTGGVSMGELDLLKPTIERSMGGTIHFGRVAMKPGKPTTFASVPFKTTAEGERSTRLVFGLPGNPASALVTASLFLLPALQKMSGYTPRGSDSDQSDSPVHWGLPRVKATLTHKIRADPKRTEYHRVVITATEAGLTATSTGVQRSSRVGSLAGANGLLIVEAGKDMDQGEKGTTLLMGSVIGY